MDRVTIPELQQMKRDGRKIVGVVAWDFQIAQIADRAEVDIVSVGDSVGINLWGHSNPLEVTMDEMIVVCKAVRRGTKRAMVSCDMPFGPLQEGVESAVRAAIRIVKEAGADMIMHCPSCNRGVRVKSQLVDGAKRRVCSRCQKSL